MLGATATLTIFPALGRGHDAPPVLTERLRDKSVSVPWSSYGEMRLFKRRRYLPILTIQSSSPQTNCSSRSFW